MNKKKRGATIWHRWRWRLLALTLVAGFVAFTFTPFVVRNMDDFIYKGENHLLTGPAMEELVSYWGKDDVYQFWYALADRIEDEEMRKEMALEFVEEDWEGGYEPKPDPYRAPGSHCHIFSVPRLLSHAICWFIFW